MKCEENASQEVVKATFEVPSDEINLAEIPNNEKLAQENQVFQVKGEFKDPKFKPWSKLDPEKGVKILWETLKDDNSKRGIEEIGDGSTCFEHCYEFWGKWKAKEPDGRLDIEFLKGSKNWPKGVTILDVSAT